jgi:hypothetical protein
MKLRWLMLSLLASGFCVRAQVPESPSDVFADPALRMDRAGDRAVILERLARIERDRSEVARARAVAEGRPVRRFVGGGGIHEIAFYDGDQPVYLKTDNSNAAISTGANLLRSSPYSLLGSGIVIGMWDGGSGRASHQEFGSRLTVMDGSASIDHATHVGGTLIASGVVSSARGMASTAQVHSYDWNSDLSEMTSRGASAAGASGKLYLSNHSYGNISGWAYVNGGSPYRAWEWYGLGTTATAIDPDFGIYNSTARDQDSLAFNAPYYLIFRSAGNDRGENPSVGQSVALSPGSLTVVSYDTALHPAGDAFYRGGYDTIGYASVAKNVITVGSATDAVTSGVRDITKANMSTFSSWGPTDDGRIKPDIVANGDGLYSALNGSDTSYGTYSGTSMSSPNACGSAALLIEQYSLLFPSSAMRASTLKGLLIHTADDRGNTGPDYRFGWGLVNVKSAADLIRDHHDQPIRQRITESQISTSVTSRTHSFVWDGVSPIRATLSWTDPAGTSTTTSESRIARLVNNLQVKLIAPDGSEHLPYVMPFVGTWTQASMELAATRGTNNTDNVEQVLISSPPVSGTYRAVVSYSGTLTNSSQNYSLLLTGSAAEEPPPPPIALTSISPSSGLSNSVVLIDLAGVSLRADTTVKLKKSGESDIVASSVQLIGETLRCQINLMGVQAGSWDVFASNPSGESSTLAGAFTVVGAIWSENFDGTLSGWTSQPTPGTNSWSVSTALSHSPTKSYFAPAPASKTTCALTSPAINIPAGASNLQLKFWHRYELQSGQDGGKLEFSINDGSWFDIADTGSGAAFASNGYNTTMSSSGNPSNRSDFAGKSAWSGNSGGFVETIVNLTDTAKYAGKSLRARWRLATNASTSSYGWHVDSVALIGGGNFTNQAPSITTAATTGSTESVTDSNSGITYQILRGTSGTLSVQASDDGGGSGLSYTWAANGSSQVFFSKNGSNDAATTDVEFEAAGDILFTVVVSDAQGLSTSSNINVRVQQTSTGLVLTPASASLPVGVSQSFAGTVTDQFDDALTNQPTSFVWSASGGGSVNASGFFTATQAGGPFIVSASDGSRNGYASVTVIPTSASVVLDGLSQTYSGTAKTVGVMTDPVGLTTSVTYDGATQAPVAAGSYPVVATITDPNYSGSAQGTLTVAKANAGVSLSGLDAIFDGAPKAASVVTDPPGLAVNLTYDELPNAPSAVGSYAVLAVVDAPNHSGSASGTLVISYASGWDAWVVANFSEVQIAQGQAAGDADPDGDRFPNLAEYALGLDPFVSNPTMQPVRDANGFWFEFQRPEGRTDVTCIAESSEDLDLWNSVILEKKLQGDPETWRARDPLTSGDPTKRFLRLRFSK